MRVTFKTLADKLKQLASVNRMLVIGILAGFGVRRLSQLHPVYYQGLNVHFDRALALLQAESEDTR